MIYTSNYKNFKDTLYNTISISGDRGKLENYNKKYYSLLAPKLSFWKVWHDNIGIISEEENNKYYIEEYYKQVLSKLDPEKVYNELNYSILLCYEENNEFCHRHIVSAWFELLLEKETPEIKLDGTIKIVERPTYIKKYLEEIIKKNKNMRGFNSLRALYLFEKGDELEQQANELELSNGKNYDSYRQAACYLRCDADEVEARYKIKQLIKNSNKRS